MEELIRYLKKTQMEGLKGLKIEGEVPVSEKQLNMLLEQFVRPRLQKKDAVPSSGIGSSPGAGASASMTDLLPLLKFPVLKVKIKDGSLVLKVKVEV